MVANLLNCYPDFKKNDDCDLLIIKVKGTAKIVFQHLYCFRREYIDLEKIVIWPPHFEIPVASPAVENISHPFVF